MMFYLLIARTSCWASVKLTVIWEATTLIYRHSNGIGCRQACILDLQPSDNTSLLVRLSLKEEMSWISDRPLFLNKRLSQMRTPVATRPEPAWGPEQAAKFSLCFWTWNVIYPNPRSIHPHRGILTYQWYTTKDFIESNLLRYPLTSYSSNICEIMLYRRQLLFSAYKMIYVVRAAHC